MECPCCSGKEYPLCCRPFHEGLPPENALQLMRSRYSAYVFHLSEYIIATTHPASPQYSENKFSWKRAIMQFSKGSVFQGLDILDFQEKGPLATVTFTAHLAQNATFTEKSYFEKWNGKWLYRAGQVAESLQKEFNLLPLAYLGEPILTTPAKPVGVITDAVKTLVKEMIATMDASDGLGIAAPQVHKNLRLFVIRPGEEVKVLIDPKLSDPSEDVWETAEGCLSIPTIRALVTRPQEITVEYTNLEGRRIKERVKEWEARVIMHEYDHLEGILFIDRLNEEEKAKLVPFLEQLERRIQCS